MARPNFLLIIVDQMAHDVIGAYGHPAVQTPHLDALAARGVSFRTTYTNSPLCAPGRASLMTGLLPHRHHVYDNGAELRATVPTFAHHLNRAGYRTVLSGKMHFVGPDQFHGFGERLTRELPPAGIELTPDWRNGPAANPGTSVNRLRSSPVDKWTLQLSYDEEVLHTSLERLRSLAAQGDPFLLCASFAHPHDPFVVTEENWRRYDGVEIPPPQAPAVPLEALHPFNQWIQIHHQADVFPLSEEETLQARRAYFAAVSYVDGLVGRLLGEVDRLGLGDDTVIVFTSDHGEMLGEHGMWFKRTFFDGSAKVPLMVAVPGRPGAGTHRMESVSLVDLTASILDLAEIPDHGEVLSGIDGSSLVPLIDGPPDSSRGAVMEYAGEGTIEPLAMLRRGRHKYVQVRGHEPLLFDLQADPAETQATNPREQPAGRSLERELTLALDVERLREEVLLSQRERLLLAAGMPAGQSWRFSVTRDPLQPYPRPEE